MTERKLEGLKVIFTGGSKGIRVHYAGALIGAGAQVAILDVVDGAELASQLNASEQRHAARVFDVDVSDEAQVKTVVDGVISWVGDVDVLINNAAVFATLGYVKMTDIEAALWDKVMAVNVRGVDLTAAIEGT